MIRRALLLVCLAVSTLQAQVTFDRLLQSGKEPQNWLTYSGNMQGQRYSPLTQIAPGNVKGLEQQWIFQAQSLVEASKGIATVKEVFRLQNQQEYLDAEEKYLPKV